MDLRDDAIDDVEDAEETRNAALIRKREQALAERIRAARGEAKHGDIFTPEVRALFRRLLAPELKGEPRRDIQSALAEDTPEQRAIPIEVNANDSAGQPFGTTPAPILAALPPLPRGLECRFVGKDLILLDQRANVVLDCMRNAIKCGPPAPATASP
jgi:hypothetical protein